MNHLTTASILLLAGSVFWGCSNTNNGAGHTDPAAKDLTAEELSKLRTTSGAICKDWQYNMQTGELTFTESASCKVVEGELQLEFKEDLIIERAKDPNFQINSPWAAMEEHQGAYSNVVRVNGQPFTGRIKGYDPSKHQVLDVWFSGGNRKGLFTVWSTSGRAHEKDFTIEANPTMDLGTVRKPILYFYPEKTAQLNVRLNFKGELTTTYPKYAAQGWTVKAQPDGTLHDAQGKEYYALYWEGLDAYRYDLSTGFVVQSEETIAFLEEKLEVLGLNRREANEFINYWLPELERNPYNLIHFAGSEYTDRAELHIEPKPQTVVRVCMVYQPLQQPVAVRPQTLQPVQRKGFTVVEWGGIEQKAQPAYVR